VKLRDDARPNRIHVKGRPPPHPLEHPRTRVFEPPPGPRVQPRLSSVTGGYGCDCVACFLVLASWVWKVPSGVWMFVRVLSTRSPAGAHCAGFSWDMEPHGVLTPRSCVVRSLVTTTSFRRRTQRLEP